MQLLPELNEGGVERGVVELSRELVRRGVDSWVLSAGGRLAGQIEQDGGHHRVIDLAGKNPLTAWSRARALRRLLRQIAPDVIHARSRVPAWLAIMANRPLRLPFVTTVHGFNSVNAYSRVMTFGDRVICVSGAIKEYIQSHYGVPDEKIVVIPRGVDLDLFDPARLDAGFMEEFRSRYGLQGKFVVTSVGRITQLKDYETFIRAISLVRNEIPGVLGLIVGGVREDKNEYFSSLQKLINSLGLTENIRFAGNQQKVAEIYAMSDVVVTSSKKPESFGRSAAEALAMNVSVVASAHGGILDIVREGETGFLFPPGDAKALADKILQARTDRLEGLRRFVQEHFTLENMVTATLGVYGQVVGK